MLKTLVCYRLIDPGSEWRLHRQWFRQTAIGDLLGEDFAVAAKDTLLQQLKLRLPAQPPPRIVAVIFRLPE